MRINEIFGPTMQGEGFLIGTPTIFVRAQGCDYQCKWCDTKYAWGKTDEISEQDLVNKILEISSKTGCYNVTITGGNPVLQDFNYVVGVLQELGYFIAVETQGSIYKEWLEKCDLVTISPKGPSSGCMTHIATVQEFYKRLKEPHKAVKIVVFDNEDYQYAKEITKALNLPRVFLQVGNSWTEDTQLELTVNDINAKLLRKLTWLANKVLNDRDMIKHATVLPQLHVLMYGNRRSV